MVTSIKRSLFVIAAILPLLVSAVAFNVRAQAATSYVVNGKIAICHHTSSATNPYTKNTVAVSAADGISGNSGNEADHYGGHQGPVPANKTQADQYKANKIEWGDIIPPIAGAHNGLNWNLVGQAIYNNGCNYPKTATASVSTVAPSCKLGEVLHYGSISNATFSGAHNGTTGPGSYSVTATANPDSLFTNLSNTKTFEGNLAGPITNEELCPVEYLVAFASVSVTPATCEAGEKLVYGSISNATFSGAHNGTTGPGSYSVTATANQGARFGGNKTTLSFTGNLAGQLSDTSCNNDPEDPETPVDPTDPADNTGGHVLGANTVASVSAPTSLPNTGAGDVLVVLFAAVSVVSVLAVGATVAARARY